MALPEDDVEELDPEPALARILDHEHDALVVGPGLRPGLATAELVRQLIVAPADETRPPLVLDAEALRSLATMDGWWDGDRRAAVLTPHAGEFARLRAGSGVDPAADGDLVDDDDARVAAAKDAATTWHQVVVLKGARTVIASPDGAVASRRSRTRRSPPAARATSSPGAIGALLAQGLTPFAAARLGVYLHGTAGEAMRERFGDAGLLASDLPGGDRHRAQAPARDARPSAEARASGWASGPRAGRSDRRGPGDPPTRARPGVTAVTAARSIEERLAAAGLPPLPRTGVAGDRPRGARAATSRRCATSPGPASPFARWSRPTHTVTAPSRSPGPSRRPAPTASASRRSTRRSRCARPGIARRSACCTPSRPRSPARRRASGIRLAGGDPGRSARCSPPARPGVDRRRSRSASSSRSRPGSAAAASPPGDVAAAAARIAAAPGAGWPGCGRTSRRARTREHRRAARAVRSAQRPRSRAAGIAVPRAARRRQRRRC